MSLFNPLIQHQLKAYGRLHPESKSRPAPRSICVIRYVCPVCDEEYDDKEDASECCAGDSDPLDEWLCPVCGAQAEDAQAAVDCCLWKVLTYTQRQEVARLIDDLDALTPQEAIDRVTKKGAP